jgi:hypothetical protein
MLISILVPRTAQKMFQVLLNSIGYWGQSNSFTQCISIDNTPPEPEECIKRVEAFSGKNNCQNACFLSDVIDGISWKELMLNRNNCITMSLFIFPYDVCEMLRESKHLLRLSQVR